MTNHKIDVPFLNLIGIQVDKMVAGESELSLSLESQHMNSMQVAHGGVVLTMVDAAMAIAAISADPGDRSVVTIELKNTFMRAAIDKVRVFGRVLHQSSTMAFCEATVMDLQGKVCGHATGTFKYFKDLPMRKKLQAQSE
jgi:uncharacterized protein (TIGR00369 family)